MVGYETLTTKTNCLPATTQSVLDKTASGPGTGCASGTAPGQIGTCVCPGDACQTFVCARRPPNVNTTHRAKIKSFITIVQMKDWAYAVKHKLVLKKRNG